MAELMIFDLRSESNVYKSEDEDIMHFNRIPFIK